MGCAPACELRRVIIALDDAARSRDGFSRSGARIFQPLLLNFAMQAQIAIGRLDDAAATLGDVDAMIEAGQRWGEAETRRVEGDLLLTRGDAAAAEACWRRAIAIAQAQGAASWKLRASMSMARLWRDQGKRNQARELLAPVYGWFTEGFDTLDLKQAKALLDELA
jgi:predicted ATPase